MYRVLYIDDEPDLLEIGRLFLEMDGTFSVDTLTSAPAALSRMRTTAYDAIISDYQMPEMDGIVFLKKVRAEFGNLPFILFTGKGREEVVVQAIDNGVDFYVQKGGDPGSQFTELAHKVKSAISRRKAEIALQESEQRLRSIYNTVGDIIFQLAVEPGGKFRFAFVNSAFSTVTGLSSDQVIGRTADELIPDHSASMVLKNYEQAIREKRVIRWEETSVYPAGEVTGEVSVVPIFDEAGTCTYLIGSVHDITGRKQAEEKLLAANEHLMASEEELREANMHLAAAEEELRSQYDALAENQKTLAASEEKYRTILENIQDVYYRTDAGGNIILLSPSANKILGYAAADTLYGRPATDYYADPAQRDRFLAALQKEGSVSNMEITLKQKDGSLVVVSTSSHYYYDAAGKPAGVEGIFRDITRFKAVQQQLRQSEELYRVLVEHVQGGAFVMQDERVLFCNRAFAAMIGYTPEELIGSPAPGLIAPEDRDMVMGRQRSRLAGASLPETYEFRMLHADGTTRVPVVLSVGTGTYQRRPAVIGTVRDVSEERACEHGLEESEAKFRDLVETSPGMIWEIDRAGTFRYVSPSSGPILGYAPEELVGKPITDLVPEEMRPFALQELGRVVSCEGPVPPFEFPARRHDGRDLVVEIRPSRVTGAKGTTVGLRGVIIDVTERRKNEDALLQANHRIQLLTSITRHDLINKVTTALGYLAILRRKLADPELAGYVTRLEDSITAIRSQMDFTRAYQVLGSREPQWQDLETLVPGGHVPDNVVLTADLGGAEVLTDPMFEKVFANLLDNSLRHGEHVTKISVSARPSDQGLVVVWEDNGVGIAAGEKEKIFERGFGKHTGLGLFLVREILSLTGVTIRETGEPGKGARFEILVPTGAYRFKTG